MIDEIEQLVLKVAQRVAQYSVLAKDGTAKGYDWILHRGAQLRARRFQVFGLRSVAEQGAEVIVLGINAGRSNKVYIAADKPGQGPTDLKPGEVALYCKKAGTLVKLDQNGKITIDAPSGQDVVVNGGSLKVARDTDPVVIGTLSGAAPPGGGAVQFIFTPAGGMPTPAGPTVTLSGKINGGADRFKG